MKTVLRHARLVTMNGTMDYFPDGFIAFSGDTILATGDEKDYRAFPDAQETDMHGSIVLPSFINCHTHLGMTAFRSLGDDMPDRLNRYLFPLENKYMTEDLVYTSSRVSMAELLLSGTSSVLDMYYFEDAVIQAAHEMHLRLWAGETLLDAPHCDGSGFDAGIQHIEHLLKKTDNTTQIVCAPHAPYSVSTEHLKQTAEFAKSNDIFWTMHVSEMPREIRAYREQYHCTPVTYLSQNNLLDSRLLAAHCIYTEDDDIRLLADNGTTVIHCPVANAKSAKGVARIRDMIQKGTHVTLGTDGPASGNTLDMFTQMKSAVIMQKNLLSDRSAMPAADIVRLATCCAGKALHSPIGVLAPGYKADVLSLSVSEPNMIPVHDVYSVIVYSAQVQNVQHVWVNGIQAVKDHVLCDTSLSSITEDFESASAAFNTAAKG
jgi:5-methylthioadenosine/S-adenosylhomocysteine deaminase